MNPHHPQRITPENAGSIPFPCWLKRTLWTYHKEAPASIRQGHGHPYTHFCESPESEYPGDIIGATMHALRPDYSTSPTKPEGVPDAQRVGDSESQHEAGHEPNAQPPAGVREALAKVLSAQHGCPPDNLEPGDAYGVDGRMPNGDPAHFNWRRFLWRSDEALKALAPFLKDSQGGDDNARDARIRPDGNEPPAIPSEPASRAASPHEAAANAIEGIFHKTPVERLCAELFPELNRALDEHAGATHPEISAGYRSLERTWNAKLAVLSRHFPTAGDAEWAKLAAEEIDDGARFGDSRIDRIASIITKHAPGATEDGRRLERALKTLTFFASVIKSGESWSQACQDEFDGAMKEGKQTRQRNDSMTR